MSAAPRELLKRCLPRRWRAPLARAARSLLGLGWRVACPCCGGRWRRFQPGGVDRRPDAACPWCGSLERQRLLWLFLRDRTGLLRDRLRLLHVAPTSDLRARLERLPGLRYVSLDLCAPEAMVRGDVTRLPFPGDGFDAVLCCHVLEHVPDDRRAMREVLRVLRPGGWAVLQTPVDPHREVTHEDPSLGQEERTRLFGQPDHVRVYGLDYGPRLREEGFLVERVSPGSWLGPGAERRFGLMPGEEIYLCRRPAV